MRKRRGKGLFRVLRLDRRIERRLHTGVKWGNDDLGRGRVFEGSGFGQSGKGRGMSGLEGLKAEQESEESAASGIDAHEPFFPEFMSEGLHIVGGACGEAEGRAEV